MTSNESNNLTTERDDEEQKPGDAFREIIVSRGSLSKYESTTYKTAFPQIIASIITCTFYIVIGIALSFSAFFIPQVERADTDLVVTEDETSWIASVIVLSGPIASVTAGMLMERFGRLNTIKIAAIPAILGWALIAAATNVPMVIIGRILTGFGCVAGTSPAVVYITEVARPDIRSSLISVGPTLASLGMVIGYIEGKLFHWRTVSWISIGFCVLPIILIQIFAPESPAWLVNQGRMEDAGDALTYLYKNYPPLEDTNKSLAMFHLDSLIREKEAKHMQRVRNSSKPDVTKTKNKSKFQYFLEPTGYKPLLSLFGLFLIQQFSGIYITLFYAVTFFQDVGTDIDPFTCSIMFGATRLAMSLLTVWLLKRFKRRPLIMTSAIGMAVCMAFSGASTYALKTGMSLPSWVPVVFLLLYVCMSMIGLLTIPWTMTAELFNSEIREIAHSISYSLANILMFVAVQVYRPLQRLLGSSYALQWFFCVICLVGFFYGLFILPETHGKKLSEIEDGFKSKSASRPNSSESKVSEVSHALLQPAVLKTINEGGAMLKPEPEPEDA